MKAILYLFILLKTMDDVHICSSYAPPLKMWSLRCDNSHNYFIQSNFIKNFCDKYHPVKFLLGLELGKTTEKPHLQGAVWFDSDIKGTKKYACIRSYLRSKAIPGKNRYSFVPARNAKSLASYATKDGNYMTNLTAQELATVKPWVESVSEDTADRYYSLKKLLKEKFIDVYQLGGEPTIFLKVFDACYKTIYGKPCSSRNFINRIAREINYIDSRSYYKSIGAIDNEGMMWGRYVNCLEDSDTEETSDLESIANSTNAGHLGDICDWLESHNVDGSPTTPFPS